MAAQGIIHPVGSERPTDGTFDPLAPTLAGTEPESAATPALPFGTVVGRYVITGVLGEGGMGVVYAAHDPDLDRPIALKLLRAELRAARPRLLREGQAVAKLQHPNVVTVHDIGAHGDDLFIAMERIRGQTFGAWTRAGGGRRRWREVLAMLIPAGRGLAAAHAAGLVHRDFKPENVLIGDDGRVVVTDFGLAQLGDDPGERPVSLEDSPVVPHAELTRTGAVLGTPAYMSPEQFRGERSDARSDQFSFCVTLYEALHGVRPFEPRSEDGAPPSVSDLASAVESGRIADAAASRDVPRWLRHAIRRGLRVDPAARFPSMQALLAAIEPPRRARGRLLALGAIPLAAVAALALGLGRADTAVTIEIPLASCDVAAAEIDGVWSRQAARTYRALHPDALGVDEEVAWLDDYARRWSRLRRAACLAGAPRTAEPLETCLDDALAHLRAATVRSHDVWPALRTLDDCGRPEPRLSAFPLAIALGPQGVAQLSPDGRRIAVSSYGEPPYLIDADPGAYRPVSIDDARVAGDWLPDGRLLLQRADRSQLLRPAGGGADLALPGRGDLLITQINTIAPDGRRVAVADGDAIEVLSIPDGAVLARVLGEAHELAWEPDGRRLAIVSRNLSELRLLDTRSGSVVAINLRTHARNLGEIGIAWRAPARLLLSGATTDQGEYALWDVALDDASRLRRAPEVRWRAPAGQLLRLFDVRGDRALVELSSSRLRLFRRHGDRSSELPAQFNDLRVHAYDATAGLALASGGGQLVRFDVTTGKRTVFPGAFMNAPALRDGHPLLVERRGGGRWALVELADDGARREVVDFDWPLGGGTPFLRCSPHDDHRCVLASRDRDTLRLARVVEGTVGPRAAVDGITGVPDVTSDGRVVAPTVDGRIVEIELPSGRTRPLATLRIPECIPRAVRVDEATGRYWLVELCPDRFAIGFATARDGFTEVERSDGWISSVEVLTGGDVLYSVMDWDPQLALLDGI